ncbi:hypothetical protein GGH96_005384, partial [Coemansia sp. RSA 1972]
MLSCFKFKNAVVRIAQSTRPTLLSLATLRHYASAIDAISLERQQEIASALRTYQKDNIAVPWLDMTKQFEISQESMEQALAADDARLQKRIKQSIRVTQLADRAYDKQRGRCDWDSVARDMDIPLIECLQLFDMALSTVPARSLPNITNWSADDISALKLFVSEHFRAVTADEWPLVSVYMNVAQIDCFMAHSMCTHPRMTPDLHEEIAQHRNDSLQWKDIFEKYPIFSRIGGLRNAYYQFKERDDAKPKAIHTEWTDEETRRIQELVQIYYKTGNQREVLIQAQKAFPDMSQESILDKIKQITSKVPEITNDDIDRVKKLVYAYGKDWGRIGQEINATPRRAQRIWTQHREQQKAPQTWNEDELDALRKCIHDGVGMTEASKLIGTKTRDACNAKMILLKCSGIWNADDATRLVQLVSNYKCGEIDWAAIGKDIGRSADSCHIIHTKLQQKHLNSTIDHSQAVSREVQKQYEQQQSVDWTEIAQQLALTERECLEANQFNTGKDRWIYHPDEFSWNMADRMTTFINENYPQPLPINYTAVSNYMWIDMDDCTKMANLLRGEMSWTAETLAKVEKLRAQGMKFVDIGKQLSPTLSAQKVSNAYHNNMQSKAHTSLSDDEKHQAKEIMETHAQQMSFTELRKLVAQKLPHVNQKKLLLKFKDD